MWRLVAMFAIAARVRAQWSVRGACACCLAYKMRGTRPHVQLFMHLGACLVANMVTSDALSVPSQLLCDMICCRGVHILLAYQGSCQPIVS